MLAEMKRAALALVVMLCILAGFTFLGIVLKVSKPVVFRPDLELETSISSRTLAIADTAQQLE